ncbi:non-ribosomal peptide synthetase [Oceanicella sp. SM1341]|uniref:non-ribosomal peptide synthetase n=1 Tax=Oceanicella sp. SM1341 TaxID=1548889 RepID=UPI0018E59244|nr:non-ribosomal peptide synthetase [Oceanicella sp. SM1341]
MTVDMPDTERFLAGLGRRGIRLSAEGGRLHCDAPDEALTDALLDELRARKPGILAFLAAAGEDTTPLRRRGSARPPLSFAQARLWFLERMVPGSAANHMAFALELTGPLDEAALEAALTALAARHEVLRARIREGAEGPEQEISPEPLVPLTRIDLPAPAPAEALLRAEARRPFDLAAEPPLRVTLVRRGPQDRLLLFTLHHIAGDGWSVGVLTAELSALYAGRGASLPALPVQYGDYAAWQREALAGPGTERLLRFWEAQLRGAPPATLLPADFPRPAVQGQEGALHGFALDAETTAALHRLARGAGTTLFATTLTAFALLVHRLSGQETVVLGTPVANRARAETEPLIGLFVNPLPLAVRFAPGEPFREALARVRGQLAGALAHQDLPFERLVEHLAPPRDPGAAPLFQIRFQCDAAAEPGLSLPGLTARLLPRADGTARLDLGMDLRETADGLSGSIEYRTDLFRPATIARLAEQFRTLLTAAAHAPDTPVAALPLLSPAERRRHVAGWNDTARPTGESFLARFEAQVHAAPEAVALVEARGETAREESYAALNRRANRLAHRLRASGVGPESVVAIALPRGADMVAAWLGVMKAGAAWLPLDPDYPPARLALMLEDSGARTVIGGTGPLPEGVTRLAPEALFAPGAPEENPGLALPPEALAYVIYTSGSTGRPKGVLVPQAGLGNLTQDKIATCDVRPGDCVLNFFSFSFDAAIPELVMALGAGARLLLAPREAVLPGPGLAALMRRHAVSHITMTPSALLALPEGAYPALRCVLTGGEAPAPELVARWAQGRRFINAYGPTETTVNASMQPCEAATPAEPLLAPAANKQLHVLDDALEPLPPGVPGELFIGGLGLARGYHGRPGLTAERFLPDPFCPPGLLYRTGDRALRLEDGRIRLIGRLDDQVKIRGFRVEPGEVAAALRAHPQLAEAVVTVRPGAGGAARLLAHAVPKSAPGEVPPEGADAPRLRDWLAERLPRHLVPDAVTLLPALPLTPNGKLDTAALPDPATARPSGRPPHGETETALAALFAELLERDEVGAEDDFFALGGHSLLATRLVAAAPARLGVSLSVLDLFGGPTVAALAARIEARRAGTAQGPAAAEDWRGDIALAPGLRPAAQVRPAPMRRVLLTGASGFLGLHLLDALLEADPERELICLLRGEGGMARLAAARAEAGLGPLPGRVTAIEGDLAAPGLGLDAEARRLAASADTIFHNGAQVHHLMPYGALRAANVEGTREVLALACAGAGRPLHHVSSLSVLPAAAEGRIAEDAALAGFPAPPGGYNRTKWVAEQLVSEAGRRGLPVTVYRPGAVSGDSRSGAFNAADILCRLLQGYIADRMAPEGEMPLDMLPVDYLARAMVHLATRPGAAGETYHLVHSAPVSSERLMEACAAEGLALRRVPHAAWHAHLQRIAREAPEHPLYPLVALFAPREEPSPRVPREEPSPRVPRPHDTARARAALADAPFAEPPLGPRLFRLYVRAFLRASPALAPTGEPAA